MPTATSGERPLEPLTQFEGARVAIVHEWIAARAGSEKVFEALAQLFPQADLYALTHAPDVHLDVGMGRAIHTTFLDRVTFLREHRELTLPVMPLAWRLRGGDYDVVISSTHAFARCFSPGRTARHLSYVHSPARYLWSPEIDGRYPPLLSRPLVPMLKRIDLRTVETTNALAANSTEVAERIQTFYGRPSTVIPPPVATDRFDDTEGSSSRDGLLTFGRWIEYKRFDVAIRAAAMADEHLTVAGRGPEGPTLRALANDLRAPVTFIESPSDAEVVELMAVHRALLFPGREDFGIIPVEAAAAGLPVIAYARGGARDTVEHGVTGWLVRDQDPRTWAQVLRTVDIEGLDSQNMRAHAETFSPTVFRQRVGQWIRREP